MSDALSNYNRKLFLDVPLPGTTQKKLAATVGDFGNDFVHVELREWVLGPDELDGPMSWKGASGVFLTPENWKRLMAVAPKITAYLEKLEK